MAVLSILVLAVLSIRVLAVLGIRVLDVAENGDCMMVVDPCMIAPSFVARATETENSIVQRPQRSKLEQAAPLEQ